MRQILCLFLSIVSCLGYRGHINELPEEHTKYFQERIFSQNVGTNFVFAIPNSHLSASDKSYTEKLTLTIVNPSSTSDAIIDIKSKYANFVPIHQTIAKNTTVTINISPVDIQTNYMDSQNGKSIKENKSISVVSDSPISLVVSNFRSDNEGGDTFSVIPVCKLSTSYAVIGDQSSPHSVKANNTNIITIIAIQDSTTVALNGLLASQYVLNSGETLTVSTSLFVNSIWVNSSSVVAVFVANVCGYSYINPEKCSYEAAMLYPDGGFGIQVPFYKFLPQNTGEVIVRFQSDKTTLYLDNVKYPGASFYRDEYLILNTTSGYNIQASNPIYVTAIGNTNTAGLGAPFYAHIPSTENFIGLDLTFSTDANSDQITNHYVRIITDDSTIGKIRVDSYQPNGLLYKRMGRGHYYFVDVPIDKGQHTIKCGSLLSYSAIVYGYGPHQSYAFTPGVAMPNNNLDC